MMYRVAIFSLVLAAYSCKPVTWDQDFDYPLIIEDNAMLTPEGVQLQGSFVGSTDLSVTNAEIIWFEYDDALGEDYRPDGFRRYPIDYAPNSRYTVTLDRHLRAGQTYLARTRLQLENGLIIYGPDRTFTPEVAHAPAWASIVEIPASAWQGKTSGQVVLRTGFERDGQIHFLIETLNANRNCVEDARLLTINPLNGNFVQEQVLTENDRILVRPPIATVGDSAYYLHRRYPCETEDYREGDYLYRASRSGEGLTLVAYLNEADSYSNHAVAHGILNIVSRDGYNIGYDLRTGEQVRGLPVSPPFNTDVQQTRYLVYNDRLVLYYEIINSNFERQLLLYEYNAERRSWESLPSVPPGIGQKFNEYNFSLVAGNEGLVVTRYYNLAFPGRDTWLFDWETRKWVYVEKSPLRWVNSRGVVSGDKAYFVGPGLDENAPLNLASFDFTLVN